MKFNHSMVRVRDLDASLDFYVNKLGLVEVKRMENEKGRYTLVFLCASEDIEELGDRAPQIELTYNWDVEDYGSARNFGHLGIEVADIYAVCDRLVKGGVTISRPPRDGRMAFVRSPDLVSIELMQRGTPLAPVEPWLSMPNSGKW